MRIELLGVLLCLSFAVVGPVPGIAGERTSVHPVEAGETVAVVGDSITSGGDFPAMLTLLQQLRFPGSRVRFLNCGVGGDTVVKGLKRWPWDVRPLGPDRVLAMFGMNDAAGEVPVGFGLEFRRLVDTARFDGVKEVDLLTPTPYDEYSPRIAAPAQSNRNERLAVCSEIVRRVAAENGAGLVEFHHPFTRLLREHPELGFVPDRVHPRERGALVMAAAFMDATGSWRGERSRVEIEMRGPGSFPYLPQSLPLPTVPEVEAVAAVYPLREIFGRETLVVKGLGAGKWRITDADGSVLGIWPSAELAEGVDLSAVNIPLKKLSLQAWQAARSLKSAQTHLRNFTRIRLMCAEQGMYMGTHWTDEAPTNIALDHWLKALLSRIGADTPAGRWHAKDVEHLKTLYGKEPEAIRAVNDAFTTMHSIVPVAAELRIEKVGER